MSLIEVSYDIPISRPRVVGGYPWKTIEVGGSFAFAKHVKPQSAWTYTWQANRRYAPKLFQCHKHKGEMRCWRIA